MPKNHQQDNAGNLYLTRSGRDSQLAAMAIEFPVDEGVSPSTFSSAFRVFSHLASEDLICDITLVGWTCLNGKPIGRDLWQSFTPLKMKQHESVAEAPAELDQFASLPNVSDLPLSALFAISENEEQALRISGSPVITSATAPSTGDNDVQIVPSPSKPRRAPAVEILGRNAERCSRQMIRDYAKYVVALFDNFD